jgi:hypothetical protein
MLRCEEKFGKTEKLEKIEGKLERRYVALWKKKEK